MIDYHQLGTPDWNDNYVHTLFVVPSKTTPDSIPNGQSVYPFSDQNGAKTLPDGAAHTYINSLYKEFRLPLPLSGVANSL